MHRNAAVSFDTTEYRSNHGAQPRGRGSWAFSFGTRAYSGGDPELFWTPGNTTFGEAKKLARAEAGRRGFAGTVYVCT